MNATITTITTKSEVIDRIVYPLAQQTGWLDALDTDTLDEALSNIFDALEKAGLIQTVWGEGWTVSDDPEQAAAISEVIIDTLIGTEDRVDVYEDNAGGIVLQRGYLAYAGWDLPVGQGVEDARAWLSGEWSPEGDLQQTMQTSWATRETKHIASITADAVELHDEPGVAGAAYLGIEG